jgi:hypothetical protein
LRVLARRAVIAADPAAARQRKEQALRDARVEAFTEHAGTAALAGRDLCPVDVLAADQYLTALARAMKAAGITGTMDTLRACAYLHLLAGQPAATLLDPAPRTTTPGRTAPGRTGPGLAGQPPAAGDPGAGSFPAPPGASPGNLHGPASPGLRGSVNLTMPLPAWLGWTQSPGEVPGSGPLDAADSRTLATLLARNPASRWCVTLTGRAGHPVAHACARPGPRPRPGPPGPGIPPGPARGPAPVMGPQVPHPRRPGPQAPAPPTARFPATNPPPPDPQAPHPEPPDPPPPGRRTGSAL